MTNADRMKEIEAREKAATEGPWVADINIYGKGKLVCCRNGFLPKGDRVAEVLELLAGLDSDSAMANALFIAHARADIPYLVSRVEELEAALGEAIDRIDPYEESIFYARLAAARDGNNAHHAQGE